MAIAYQDAVTAYATGASLTFTPTAGANLAGRVGVVVIGYWTSSAPVTPPSGWTLLDSNTISSNAGAVYYRVFGTDPYTPVTEPASYAWTFGGSLDEQVSAMVIYSGVNTTTPVQVYSKGATANDTPTATGVTVSSQPAQLLFLLGSNSSGSAQYTVTPPENYTERAERHGASYGGAYIADRYVTATGATGDVAASLASAASWVSFLVALSEGAAAAADVPVALLRRRPAINIDSWR